MKYSIIVPNYNGQETIRSTLASIRQQKLRDAEIIVVDDCSTDKSVQIVKEYAPKARVIRLRSNSGAAHARNIGIRAAKGRYVVFVDSDVKLEKNCIRTLMNETDADISFPTIEYANKVPMYPANDSHKEYLLVTPTFIMKRTALNKLHNQFFDESYGIYGEDTDFFLRCRLLGLTCQHSARAKATHIVVKPKNREHRYYLEVRNSTYGLIKFSGFKDISRLDHAFKPTAVAKILACGLFNYNIFDAQTRGYNKNGSAAYKLKLLFSEHPQITERGAFRLGILSVKGIWATAKNFRAPLRQRRQLKQEIQTSTSQ